MKIKVEGWRDGGSEIIELEFEPERSTSIFKTYGLLRIDQGSQYRFDLFEMRAAIQALIDASSK